MGKSTGELEEEEEERGGGLFGVMYKPHLQHIYTAD